jgi:prolyl oligopeptidase
MQLNPIRKTVGGVTYEDRFAHLHEDTPEALAWQWERDAAAKAAAEASPNYAPILGWLRQSGGFGSHRVPSQRGGLWFGYAEEGGDTVLRVSEEPNGPGRTLASAQAIAKSNGGGNAMMGWLTPSPKGRYVAVVWGVDGDMLGKWSIYETASGRLVRTIDAIMYTGARPGWLPDESGFWLDGRTAEGLHKLHFVTVAEGTTERSEVLLPESLVEARHSGLTPQVSPDGRRAVIVTEPHEHVALVLFDLETLEAKPFLPDDFEGECDGSWIDGETYVARVNDDSPRGRVVAIPAATSRDVSTWRALVPASEGYIGWAGVIAGKLYVGDLVDVSLRVRVFDLNGSLSETLPLENPGSALSMTLERGVRPTDSFIFTHTTLTRSPVTLVHDPDSGALRQIDEARHRLDAVAEQHFAVSKDGTRIPYFTVRRKDLDTSRPQPALVYAYGGFNASQLPGFPANFVPFIEAGGIYVQACLRGGAEYGKAWHDGGRLFNKRNTFDDLEAVAETLIADGVSTPAQLAFEGASNGGLLAGAAIAFQPHLWRVVAPVVPIYDIMEMLPLVPENAGVRAIMYEDYGDPTEPEVAQSVIGWSPYQNLKDGVVYPAVFQMFGEKDLGCMPFHGRKFTARLDEANAGPHPIHLRVWRDTGHGTLDPAWNAEWLAFVMDQLGMTAKGAKA